MQVVRYRIEVHGLVQGVWFRKHTQAEALRLGVHGTVRNRPDGTVLIEAEGPLDKVNALIRWCRQGPPKARVELVRSTRTEIRHATGFHIEG